MAGHGRVYDDGKIRTIGVSNFHPDRVMDLMVHNEAQAKRLLQRDQGRYVTDRKLHFGNNEWHETTLQYRRKENTNRQITVSTPCS